MHVLESATFGATSSTFCLALKNTFLHHEEESFWIISSTLPIFLSATQGGGEDSSGQRYSADPTGLLAERGAKGDKDQDTYMTAMRDKNNSGCTFTVLSTTVCVHNVFLYGYKTESNRIVLIYLYFTLWYMICKPKSCWTAGFIL